MEDKIVKILPKLSEIEICNVVDTLQSLGVESWADLKHLEPNDFAGSLKLVQAKKLINSWVLDTDEASSSLSSTVPVSHASTSLESCSSLEEWDYNFVVPWDSFPKSLRSACEQEERPLHRDRLEMVRILVDKVKEVAQAPQKRNWERIANKIVSKYPASFKDEVGGLTLGNGRQSLTSQLMFRFGNITTLPKNPHLKRKRQHEASTNADNFQSGEESNDNVIHDHELVAIQSQPKSMYFLKDCDENEVDKLMEQSFLLQRKHIKEKMLICDIKNEWPFLLQEKYMFGHFATLMCLKSDESVRERFCSNLEIYGIKILETMEMSTKPAIQQLVGKLKEQARLLGDDRAKYYGTINLIAVYFNESISSVVQCFEDSSVSMEELVREEMENIPPHPIIVCQGQCAAEAKTFAVTLEKCLALTTESFLTAIAYCFCAYYVFDMQYPKDAKATLEFIQRFLGGVGSPKQAAKKRTSFVNPKVLRLCNAIKKSTGAKMNS